MTRPIATTVLALALLVGEGAPVAPPASTVVPPNTAGSGSPEQYRQFRERTGYPHPFQSYARLPGYQKCGTACGQPPTSGEQQRRYLCEQGRIDRSRC